MIRFPHLISVLMAFRSLETHPRRTILTLIGVSLGVAVILATDITNQNSLSALEGIFDRTVGNAELMVLPPGKEETLESEILKRVQRVQGVKLAVPTVYVETSLVNDPDYTKTYWSAEGVQVGRKLEVWGIDPVLEPKIRVYVLASGKFPEPGRREALIPKKFAEQNHFEMGDELSLFTPDGSENLKIVGLLADDGVAMVNEGEVAFAPIETVQKIFSIGDRLQEISIQEEGSFGGDPHALAVLKSNLEERLGEDARVTYPVARGQLVPRMASSYHLALSFFSIIALYMGVFLIYNTFSMTIFERTQEIGMLRAIGMQRRQVLALVLIEGGLLAVAGCIFGIAAGLLLARGLTYLMSIFTPTDEREFLLTGLNLVKSAGIGLAGTLAATLIPAYSAAHITPLQALRVRGSSAKKVKPWVWLFGLILLSVGCLFLYQPEQAPPEILSYIRMGAFLVFLMGSVLTVPLAIRILEPQNRRMIGWLYRKEGNLGAGNIRRSVTRTVVTVASLMISLVMIVAVDSTVSILKQDIQSWVNNAIGGDLLLTSEYPLHDSFTNRLQSMPGVQAASPTRIIEVRVAQSSLDPAKKQKESLFFFAVDPSSFRQVGDKAFVSGQGDPNAAWSRLSQGSAIFVSTVVADEYNLRQGSQLTLITNHGEHPFVVAAVTTEFTREGFIITGTAGDLHRWFDESGANFFSLKVEPGYDIEKIGQKIRDLYENRYALRVQTTETYQNSVLTFYNQATNLFNVLSLIAVIIGLMGIANTMNMNVLERTCEIGVLRSVGMTRRQIIRMVLAEALAIGTFGGLYGILCGYVISRFILMIGNLLSGYELQYVIVPRPYLTSLFIAFLVSQLASIGPARRGVRINIVEAIKHE